MADKKKKIFPTSKDSIARRALILKSDRDTKEQVKEKPEKEKQPTIILKTREQSTPKEDRPQSPKSSKPLTDDGPVPCKIAYNGNKEKRSAEQKPLPPLKYMTEPVKLLDENLEFNNAALEFLHDSSTDYLVVGIIGTSGVGKSMVMNILASNDHDQDFCHRILNSHETPADAFEPHNVAVENEMAALNFVDASDNKAKETNNKFLFKMQSIEHIERGVHCTKGVDMYVTRDRVILLDCQALWSASLIEETSASPVTVRSANIAMVDCLQVASFLMAVCHVLIPLQDWFADYNFIRYIQAAEMLKPSLSASSTAASQDSSESTTSGESHPHMLLLHNRCQLEDFTPESVRAMQDLYRKAFQKSDLQLNSGMYMYGDTNKNGVNVDNICKGYSVEACGSPINLFLLPEIYSDFDNRYIYRGHPPFDVLARRLRWTVLGASRHQLTSVPSLSERGWFHYCSKAWETVTKCTFYLEYERFLP